MSFRTLPSETSLDLDGASTLLAYQSLYRYRLNVDSRGGPMKLRGNFFLLHFCLSVDLATPSDPCRDDNKWVEITLLPISN